MSAALLCFRGSGANDVFEYERLGRFSTGSTIVLCSPWGFFLGGGVLVSMGAGSPEMFCDAEVR